ncbi:Syntaxin-related protein KNOLLE [Prunus dulcis]|uniref:Syntaxin-related protein KNOLLE n=1 Tax=Prunus dulcis TaxID=3755 RepID=A0A4Y1RRE7_PRUDU|nr:Syntaxin-related protein KNOLLE [Prunus dulcis]
MTEYKETVGRRYFTVTGEHRMRRLSKRSSRMGMETAARSFLGRPYKSMEGKGAGNCGGDTGQARRGEGD